MFVNVEHSLWFREITRSGGLDSEEEETRGMLLVCVGVCGQGKAPEDREGEIRAWSPWRGPLFLTLLWTGKGGLFSISRSFCL